MSWELPFIFGSLLGVVAGYVLGIMAGSRRK